MPCRDHPFGVTSLLCLTILVIATVPAHGDTGVNDQIVSQSFQLRAEIVPGCLLGAGGSDATSFGSISFGSISTLPSNLDAASTPGNGSIVLQCSPGTAVSISLNAGLNASSVGGGRYLARGAERLRYQLYQDAARSLIWGDGSNGGTRLSVNFPVGSATQTYTVYARLFAVSPLPSAGIYTDTITVTVSY
ncbi:Csu type fimbrial protein [Ectopseudomonas mendocina]|uniref:Spore coat protein n=1 Tax=Ectopseudomonas mendocina S5.2 TaxID=1225174 RepID=A0ABN4ITX4_ECTME|nr:spore coat U domain-containing protein [Pseudomonas mendocina]AEB58740.1 spore coat U domain-containing protein [Pseudomonas mendocina NK-01]ALN19109.1 spore coat protein [Pseudomonas mendocina S5.2]MBL0951347.1 spore coat protein U domain-containing protein [Pseudomonas sp.]